MHKRRSALLGGLLAILIALLATLVLLFVTLMNTPDSTTGIKPAATVARPTATPTPPPLHATAAQGWVDVNTHIPVVFDVQFGNNNPYVGYACGTTQGSAFKSPIQVSRTQDGGRTWHASAPMDLNYVGCGLEVNPANAQDVLLAGDVCYAVDGGCDGNDVPDWFVSRDGGASWSQVLPPAGEPERLSILQITWSASDLLVRFSHLTQIPDGVVEHHYLAASMNGAPLAWIDGPQFYAQSDSTFPTDMTTINTTWQVVFTVPPDLFCPNKVPCNVVLQSTDHGQTWRKFFMTGTYPSDIIPGKDGKHQYGIERSFTNNVFNEEVVQSSDGNHTWSALQMQPAISINDLLGVDTLITAPDGSLYLPQNLQPPSGGNTITQMVYGYNPAKQNWSVVSTNQGSLLEGYNPTCVSYGLDHRPFVLWGVRYKGTASGVTFATAVYHAPVGAP